MPIKIVIKGVKIFINKCDVESGGNKKVRFQQAGVRIVDVL